jgi:hypothetical protein
MRRLVLVPAIVAGCAFGMLPAPAAPYVGESSVASAASIIRGTDGVLYQIQVIVAQHDAAGLQSDYELRIGIGTCGEGGCFGPTYAVPVAAKDVKFTGMTASVTTKFGGAPVTVTWKARKAKAEPGLPDPAAGDDNGTVAATVYRQDRSAPAVVTVAGLRCGTRTSHLTNQTGARITIDDGTSSPPSKLPKGFFKTSRRVPRCA